jgi:hypothetical protein
MAGQVRRGHSVTLPLLPVTWRPRPGLASGSSGRCGARRRRPRQRSRSAIAWVPRKNRPAPPPGRPDRNHVCQRGRERSRRRRRNLSHASRSGAWSTGAASRLSGKRAMPVAISPGAAAGVRRSAVTRTIDRDQRAVERATSSTHYVKRRAVSSIRSRCRPLQVPTAPGSCRPARRRIRRGDGRPPPAQTRTPMIHA